MRGRITQWAWVIVNNMETNIGTKSSKLRVGLHVNKDGDVVINQYDGAETVAEIIVSQRSARRVASEIMRIMDDKSAQEGE